MNQSIHGFRRIASLAMRRNPQATSNSSSVRLPRSSLIGSFSTSPRMTNDDDEEWTIPSNLQIDPKSSVAKLYGVSNTSSSYAQVDDDDEYVEESDNEGNNGIDSDLEDEEKSFDNDKEYDDDDDDDDEVQDLKYFQQETPQFVIPLPDRLHQTIYGFPSAEEVGTIHLSASVFGQDPIRTDILHRCVVYQRNKKRGKRNAGARTKTISEVSGSGAKVRRQKGGGIARAGHKRPAHWRGGAKAHGPKGSIQDYTTKLNKKVRKMGVKMALSQKLKEGNLILVDGFTALESYKTKTLANTLKKLGNMGGRSGCSAYLVDHVEENDDEEDTFTSLNGVDINLKVACGNLMRVEATNQRNVNVYDLLKHEKVVMSLSAFEAIEARYNE